MHRLLFLPALLLLAALGSACSHNGYINYPYAPGDVREPSETTIIGAGFYFGFCGGFDCSGHLALELETISYFPGVGEDEQANTNTGTWKVAGVDRIEAVEEALGQTDLEANYGCPDCVDQGGRYLNLFHSETAQESRVDYDPTDVHEVLQEADELLSDLLRAMRTCTDTAEVDVDQSTCSPLETPDP